MKLKKSKSKIMKLQSPQYTNFKGLANILPSPAHNNRPAYLLHFFTHYSSIKIENITKLYKRDNLTARSF